MKTSVSDLIDFKMRVALTRGEEKEDTTQMTVRIPESLKIKLDVMSAFVGGTRNSLLVDLLEAACEEAIERINDNPFIENMTINGVNVHQAIKAAMDGDPKHVGTLEEDDTYHAMDMAIDKGSKSKNKR